MKNLFIVLLGFCLPTGFLWAQTMEQDFEKLLVKEPKGAPIVKSRSLDFAKTYGKKAIPFLTLQAKNRHELVARQTAVGILGAVGGAAAADSLVSIARHNTSYISQLAVLTLSDTKIKNIKQRLESMAAQSDPGRIRTGAAVALRWEGDRQSAIRLKQLADTTKYNETAAALRNTARSILFGLDSLPQGVTAQQWQGYERRFWQYHYTRSGERDMYADLQKVAEKIEAEGSLPPVFLQRFDQREWWEAQVIAIILIGMQKDSVAIPYLKPFVEKPQSMAAKAAFKALVQIGTPEIYFILENSLLWDESAPKKYIVELLVQHGDQQAALFLDRLATVVPQPEWAEYYRERAKAIIRR